MVIIEAFAQSHAFGVLGVLAHMHVVPSGGMFQQVHDAHRVGRLPAILKPDLGHEFVHRVQER